MPSQTDLLSRLLDASDLRHRVVSQNLANVNTPQYHRREVQFEQELAQRLSLGSSDEKLAAIQSHVVIDHQLSERSDGNNVDIDRETGELQKNSLLYQTYSQVLASQFSMMRRAINGT